MRTRILEGFQDFCQQHRIMWPGTQSILFRVYTAAVVRGGNAARQEIIEAITSARPELELSCEQLEAINCVIRSTMHQEMTTYEQWRLNFSDSEQAAKSAFEELRTLKEQLAHVL